MITPRIMPRPGLLGMAAMPVEFSPMSKSRLAGVAPGMSDLMTEVERRALASGIRLQVSEGMRDANRQAGLVAAGKSQTMNSKHLTGNAVDVNIVNPDGSVNWDFEAYRPVAEIAKQVAAERGFPNFVWGGDWKTLKDGVHFQLGGASQPPQTEVAAMAGGNGVPSLLGGGAQDQLAPEPKKGLLGFLSNPDARARLAIALEGMTLNPNEAFMQSMQQGIQTRGETKAATEAKNKTAAWLRSQGREDLAAAVEGGIVSGSDAFAAMKPGEPVNGVEVGNNLVNPITGEVIYTGAEGSNTPSSFLALDLQAQAAGLTKGSPEYQQFMLTGGSPQSTMPAAFVALDQQAQAAGFVPGSAEYKQFMATRGAGLVEAAKLTATAQTEAQIAAPADIAAAEKIIGEIDAVRNDPALAMATGASSVLNQIPGTPGYDFQNRVNQLASGAFLTAIDQMRGMGALSNAEGQTATRAITRLNTATSEAEFKSALSDYEAIVKTGLERAKAKVAPAAAATAAPADTGVLSESDLQYLGAP